MNYKCIFCQLRSFEKLLEKYQLTENQKNSLTKEFLSWFSEIGDNIKSPEITRDIHAKIRQVLQDNDPFHEDKKSANEYLLSRYDEFRNLIDQAEDPFKTALKLAIAGNIIDLGPGTNFDVDQTIQHVLQSEFSVDHSEKLRKAIENAKTILYLGDNAGEIVMDRLFIETLGHPHVRYAVRGKPVLNDVTKEDANKVGMQKVARVISNGYDAPSTLLSRASAKFRDVYENADLIISKGMGNLEGLLEVKNKDIYFLLMVKCQVIGDLIDAKKGDIVVRRNNFSNKYIN